MPLYPLHILHQSGPGAWLVIPFLLISCWGTGCTRSEVESSLTPHLRGHWNHYSHECSNLLYC